MSILRWKQKLFADGGVARGGDGGGGSSAPAPSPTNTTVTNTNIPDYAKPYVETMLGAGQQQIFDYATNADGTMSPTGIKPYTPYSNNATDYIAGFSPLQQQAQSNVANMQTPGAYGDANDMAATSGMGALSTANPAAGYGGLGANAGLAGMQAGMSYGQNATNPNAVAAYMNPYIQNTLNPSLQLQNQQFGQLNAQNQGQATQQGAFGGGRQAVMQGLNQQNQMLAQNQLVGNAYNQAYNTANQNMQTAGSQAMQGTAQAMQGAGIGLQGVGAQQAAYGQLGNQAANMANIAGQQTQSALGINAAQQASGAAQQAQQQNIINQQIQNYATAQQYPMMQLSNMSNLLRGLPMQSATTQTYQAAPSAVSQLGGLGATALGAYGASGGFKTAAQGGLMKSYAAGGQVAFDVGGSVESDLYNMDDAHLMQEAKSSPSMEIRRDAAKIIAERQMENRAVAGGVGAAPNGMQMAGGGIVAFVDNKDQPVDEDMPAKDDAPKMTKEEVNGLMSGRLPKGSLERLSPKEQDSIKDETAFSNLQSPTRNPNEWRGPIDTLTDLYNPKRVDPKTGALVTQTEYEQGPTYPTTSQAPALPAAPTGPVAAPTGPVAAPTGPVAASVASKGLGNTPQAGALTGYEAEIKKRLAGMDDGLGNSKSQADLDTLRKEIGAGKNDALWQALMMGGMKAMGGRSPWAGVNIGEGGVEGIKSYGEAKKAEREDKKLLVAQQAALDQAEYARKTGNLNALIAAQGRIDTLKMHEQTLKGQYAAIAASKEATLDAAKQKTYADTYMKAYVANGGDDAASRAVADKAMQMTPGISGQDAQAIKWAKANPKDPRAVTIMQRFPGA